MVVRGEGAVVTEEVRRPPVAELTRWRDRCIRLISTCPDAFLEVDAAGLVIEWNSRAGELLGWSRDEVIGRPAGETVLPAGLGPSPFRPDAGSDGPPNGDRYRIQLMHRAGRNIDAEAMVFTTGYGATRCVSGFIRSLEPAEPAPASPTTGIDHTGDPLTGLPDRPQFTDVLTRALADAGGAPGSVAVALLDLDRFKGVNSSMGHEAGDRGPGGSG